MTMTTPVVDIRRSDDRFHTRTGWLVAVGGAFVTTAVLFSAASGIFHPYYVSLLAPFTAALVGAGAVTLWRGGRRTGEDHGKDQAEHEGRGQAAAGADASPQGPGPYFRQSHPRPDGCIPLHSAQA